MTRSASTAREVVINVTALLVIGSIHLLNEAAARRGEHVGLPVGAISFIDPRMWGVVVVQILGCNGNQDRIQSACFLEGFKGVCLVFTLADTASFNPVM
jgi:hypothetical protein